MKEFRRDESNLRFSRQLALILVTAVMTLFLVIGATTIWISREHNTLSEVGTKRMITGGLSALDDKLQTITLDYSVLTPAEFADQLKPARKIA